MRTRCPPFQNQMAAPLIRRLAGIRFEDRTPELPEKLPRMDIAIFVGFASGGATAPTGRASRMRRNLRNSSATICRSRGTLEKGARTFANLAPAVRAFFRNGGRRCWVIRVAEAPETRFLPVPGLVQISGRRAARRRFARGRSPGSWFDGFRTARGAHGAELSRCSAGQRISARSTCGSAPRDTLRAGDLLRLTFATERQQAFFVVESAEPALSSPPETRRAALRSARAAARFVALARWRTSCPQASSASEWMRLPNVDRERDGDVLRALAARNRSPARITLDNLAPGFTPPPGVLAAAGSSAPARRSGFMSMRRSSTAESGSPPGARRPARRPRTFRGAAVRPLQRPLATAARRKAHVRVARAARRERHDPHGRSRLCAGASALLECVAGRCGTFRGDRLPAGDRGRVGTSIRGALAGGTRAALSARGRSQREPRLHSHRDERARAAVTRAGASRSQCARTRRARAVFLVDLSRCAPRSSRALRRCSPRPSSSASRRRAMAQHASELCSASTPRSRSRKRRSLPCLTRRIVAGDRSHPPSPPAPVASQPRDHPSWWHFLECDPPASPPSADAPEFRRVSRMRAASSRSAPFLELIGPDASGAIMLQLDE